MNILGSRVELLWKFVISRRFGLHFEVIITRGEELVPIETIILQHEEAISYLPSNQAEIIRN